MSYTPLFDPPVVSEDDPGASYPPSSKGEPVYVYTKKVKLAVNVAMATGRPLLLRGDPGTGKSTLARHVAWWLKRRYYKEVITSRTRAQDLQWYFDALRRLQDAQAFKEGKDLNPVQYLQPGVLWWALDPKTAQETALFRNTTPVNSKDQPADSEEPYDPDPAQFKERADEDAKEQGRRRKPAVVLLDEIDKADPDVPNNLLDVLDSQQFKVAETRTVVEGKPPLIFITTNGERELPEAFLRRCVILKLKGHQKPMLKTIARVHFPDDDDDFRFITDGLIDDVYQRLKTVTEKADDLKVRGPSTAEFLDTLCACNNLKIKNSEDDDWKAITQATLWKAKVTPEKEGKADGEGAS